MKEHENYLDSSTVVWLFVLTKKTDFQKAGMWRTTDVICTCCVLRDQCVVLMYRQKTKLHSEINRISLQRFSLHASIELLKLPACSL